MKEKFRNHLAYNWWLYIVVAVLVLVLWLSLFSRLAQPNNNEQINITYIGTSFDHLKLQSDLYDELPERTEQNIKKISVENAVIDGEYDLNTLLRARLAGNCDFVIIEGSIIEEYEIDLASYFAQLDIASFERIFGDIEAVTTDDKIFGLLCNSGTKMDNYYSGKNTCKIFFNKNSVNLSNLFGGKVEQDAAVQVIKYLTERKDVKA